MLRRRVETLSRGVGSGVSIPFVSLNFSLARNSAARLQIYAPLGQVTVTYIFVNILVYSYHFPFPSGIAGCHYVLQAALCDLQPFRFVSSELNEASITDGNYRSSESYL